MHTLDGPSKSSDGGPEGDARVETFELCQERFVGAAVLEKSELVGGDPSSAPARQNVTLQSAFPAPAARRFRRDSVSHGAGGLCRERAPTADLAGRDFVNARSRSLRVWRPRAVSMFRIRSEQGVACPGLVDEARKGAAGRHHAVEVGLTRSTIDPQRFACGKIAVIP